MTSESDKELIVALQNSDLDAFNTLYWRYHQSVYRNIFKITSDKEVSKDILQDVFVALWEKRNTIDPQKPFSSWIFVVSYNMSISFLRRSLKASLAISGSLDDIKSDEDRANSQEERLNLLNEAIEKLSGRKRTVLELCKIQGKTYDEAAKELSISKNTVKEYLQAAMASLKNYLKQNSLFNFIIVLFLN